MLYAAIKNVAIKLRNMLQSQEEVVPQGCYNDDL